MGRLSAYERGRGRVGETWFPLRERAEGERRSCRESFRFAALFARDLRLVAGDEVPVPNDLFAADVEAVDAVRPGEDEACDRVRGAAELQPVRSPDGEVRAFPGREPADVVPAEDRRTAARAEVQRVACRQRLRPTAGAGDEQRLLDLEEEV